MHTDGEILALDMAGANPLLFGVSHDWDLLRTDDFGGRVPALAVLGLAVHLDVLGIVATVAQRGMIQAGQPRNENGPLGGGPDSYFLGLGGPLKSCHRSVPECKPPKLGQSILNTSRHNCMIQR